MATYNAAAVSNTAIAFRKPITLQQGRALRDNPLAIAEGADDAPRNVGKSLDLGVKLFTTTGTGVVIDSLADSLQIDFTAGFYATSSDSGASATLRIEGSNDGGSTWGSPQIISVITMATSGLSEGGAVNLLIIRGNGNVWGGGPGQSPENLGVSNVNALRVSITYVSATGSVRGFLKCTGGEP